MLRRIPKKKNSSGKNYEKPQMQIKEDSYE